MSERTVILFRAAFDKLREGRTTVRLPDSEGRLVAVFPKRVWSSTRVPALQPSLVLSSADLDLIGRDVEGLVCASTDGSTAWTVWVAS